MNQPVIPSAMRKPPPAVAGRRTASRTAIISALLIGVAAPWVGHGQTLPYQSPQQTLGTVTCASSLCHGAIKQWKDSPVLQNEYVTWSRTDKHTRAYNVLLNARAQKIARNLGLKQPAHESRICLDCHAHNIPIERRGERFKFVEEIGRAHV